MCLAKYQAHCCKYNTAHVYVLEPSSSYIAFKGVYCSKAAVLAEAATSQASPPPPALVKGDGQRETTETSLRPQLIVSPWGIYKLHTGRQGWAVGWP